ncbi:MAG: DNA gyrase modulator [Pararobbsia sp.]
MNIIEPGIRNLAIAKDVLLTPYGLDEGLLLRTLGEIFTHKVDYADLYFQTTRSEAWSLEEGIVKSGSFSIDQGVGVRAVAGDRDSVRLLRRPVGRRAAAGRACDPRDRPRRRLGQGPRQGRACGCAASRGVISICRPDPLNSLDATAKVALLERVEGIARKRDRASSRSWRVSRANTTWCSSRAATARSPRISGRSCACRSR